ncbi:MAG: carboxypeptidase regulatory-like domain-containing protein [Anaerolineae bacterium]
MSRPKAFVMAVCVIAMLALLFYGGQVSAMSDPNPLRASPAYSPVVAANKIDAEVCGTVTAYVPTVSVTVGGTLLNFAVGATINGANLLQVGANVCVAYTTNGLGLVTSAQVTAQTPQATATLPIPTLPLPTSTVGVNTTINICGVVTAFQAATANAPGSITIGAVTYPIAIGTLLQGQDAVRTGDNVCLSATVNASGQISGGQITINAGGNVNVCGVVSAYTAATALTAGSVTIGGQTIPIAAGTTLTGQDLLTIGSNVCLSGTLNGVGQVSSGGVTANAGGTVNVCGVVTAFQAATAIVPGSITIGGQTFPIAAGTTLTGQDNVNLGSSYCLSGTLNASGQLSNGTLTLDAAGQVCGVVTALSANSITIDGQVLVLAPNATVGPGVGACVSACAQINTAGQVISVSVNAAAMVSGVVTAYAPGFSITVNGQTFPLAPSANISGNVGVGATVTLALNGAGQAACITVTSPGSTATATATMTAVPSETATATATATGAAGGTATPTATATGAAGGTATPTATATSTAVPGGTATATATATGTAPPTPMPGLSNVCGTVYDAVTHQPIPGATVELFTASGSSQGSVTADANGRYCFYNVPPGSYVAIGSHPNYNPDQRPAQATPDHTTTVDLFLTPFNVGTPTPIPTATPAAGAPTGSLCGYVTNQATGAVMVGAIVELFDERGVVIAHTVTDTTGHYCFANVPVGPYSLVAHMPECPGQLQCASQMVRVQIVTAQAQRVDVALQCAMARPHTLYLPLIEEDMPPR